MLKTSVGIDISDSTIKVVELSREGEKFNIISKGRLELESGIIERGIIKDKESLAQAVQYVFKSAQPKQIQAKEIIFSLPESQVYTQILKIQPGEKSELDIKVLEAVKNNIPLKPEEIILNYKFLDHSLRANHKNEITVLAAVVKREVIAMWHEFFSRLGISVNLFDIESLAQVRGILRVLPEKPLALLDMGAHTSNLSIITNQGLLYNYAIPIAGEALAKQFAQALKIDYQEAENLKRKDGIGNSDKVKNIQKIVLEKIINEAKLNLNYFKKKSDIEVKEIMLLGGTSRLKGLLNYFKDQFQDKSVSLAAPVIEAAAKNYMYIEAIGIAVRGLDDKWSRTDPGFIYPKEDKRVEIVSRNVADKALSLITKIKAADKKKISLIAGIIAILMFVFTGILLFYFPTPPTVSKNGITPAINQASVEATSSETNVVDADEKKPAVIIRIKGLSASLNIRSGPGTSYAVVGHALPSTEYVLVEENGEWYKIKVNDGLNGWVFANFTKKISN